MVNHAEQLHTAARRYCIERYAYWAKKYEELGDDLSDPIAYAYTDEELNVFPRYHVLQAILEEVERFRPGDFADLAEARRKLSEAANSAENMLTRSPQGPIEQAAMIEEREAFSRMIEASPKMNWAELSLYSTAALCLRLKVTRSRQT